MTGRRNRRASGDLIVLERANEPSGGDPGAATIRVLLGEGGGLARAGLRALLEGEPDIAVAGEASGGEEAIALARHTRPDVVLMDIGLPGLDATEATRRMLADPDLSHLKVVLLTTGDSDEELFSGLRAGASGLLGKDAESAELLHTLRVVAGGEAQLSPSVTRRLIEEFVSRPDPERPAPEELEELTPREREVMTLVAMGLTNGDIAEQLVVSPATAKTHVSRAMVKLHAHDRAKLVALAYETGLAQPRRRLADAGGGAPLPARALAVA